MLYINGFVLTSFTNKWKAFFKFQIRFRIFGRKSKTFVIELRGVNIDQIAMCYTSINLSGQALQNNKRLFSNFGIIF